MAEFIWFAVVLRFVRRSAGWCYDLVLRGGAFGAGVCCTFFGSFGGAVAFGFPCFIVAGLIMMSFCCANACGFGLCGWCQFVGGILFVSFSLCLWVLVF